jgi:hypothetical protein
MTNDPEITEEPWHDAAIEADYQWSRFTDAKTPLEQANALVNLANAMDDLRTFLPGYDYESGTLPWERESE